ncbi:MAG: hypothetical protein JOY82_14680 [Streptosporangiaceae bacterium]|nr:hypothetical protein [Streptosporangiaceae bacterium]MBV9855735.1 hypothetical protein [Streptosporangiaceae bacterium]
MAGILPPGVLADFGDLAVLRQAETLVRGRLADQAALNGLLARLEKSGVQVLEVRRFRRPHPS